jgi:hypothetical protein
MRTSPVFGSGATRLMPLIRIFWRLGSVTEAVPVAGTMGMTAPARGRSAHPMQKPVTTNTTAATAPEAGAKRNIEDQPLSNPRQPKSS